MNKEQIKTALEELRKNSKKRNFDQSIDLIVNLREMNIKKVEENIDLFIALPHLMNKNIKICAFVSKELKQKAKIFDKVISDDEFTEYQKKQETRSLAKSYDIFLAQANIMGKVATTFGKILGPKGKMPNPKAGHVLSSDSDLENIKNRINSTIRLKTKNELIVKASVGKESMKDEDIIDNFSSALNALIHALPREDKNIKAIYLKTTMGKPIKL